MFWDAVSAVATLASVVVAVVAVILARSSVKEMGKQNVGVMDQLQIAIKANEIAIKSNERDERRWDAERSRFDQEHARSFSVWSEFVTHRLHQDPSKPTQDEKLILKLHNGSSTGIRDISIAMDLGTLKEPKIYYAVPKQKFLPQTLQNPKAVELEPDRSQKWREWCDHSARKNYEPNVEAIFKDGVGQRWLQKHGGDLQKIDCECAFPAWWNNATGKPFPNACRCPDAVLNSRE